jgi:hypothetical protein
MKSPADSTAPCPTAPRSPASYEPGINVLFQQSDDGHFTNLAAELADWSKPRISRGLAIADFDRDGDQDMAIADLYDGVRLIRNDMALGHAINLNLRSLNAQGLPTGRGEGFVAIAWVDGVPCDAVSPAPVISPKTPPPSTGASATEPASTASKSDGTPAPPTSWKTCRPTPPGNGPRANPNPGRPTLLPEPQHCPPPQIRQIPKPAPSSSGDCTAQAWTPSNAITTRYMPSRCSAAHSS